MRRVSACRRTRGHWTRQPSPGVRMAEASAAAHRARSPQCGTRQSRRRPWWSQVRGAACLRESAAGPSRPPARSHSARAPPPAPNGDPLRPAGAASRETIAPGTFAQTRRRDHPASRPGPAAGRQRWTADSQRPGSLEGCLASAPAAATLRRCSRALVTACPIPCGSSRRRDSRRRSHARTSSRAAPDERRIVRRSRRRDVRISQTAHVRQRRILDPAARVAAG